MKDFTPGHSETHIIDTSTINEAARVRTHAAGVHMVPMAHPHVLAWGSTPRHVLDRWGGGKYFLKKERKSRDIQLSHGQFR